MTHDEYELEILRVAAGGAGVAHLPDGMVAFVAGALPGEQVRASIDDRSKRFANATTLEVLTPSPHRVTPTCTAIPRGCGGCDFAHVSPAHQPTYKAHIVRDAIERVARLEAPEIHLGPELPSAGYRTTVRTGIHEGKPAYHERSSDRLVTPDWCEVAHPDLAAILQEGRFPHAHEIRARVSTTGGGRMVICDPSVEGASAPNDVIIVEPNADEWIRQAILGYTFQISGESFFQSSAIGATALVEVVRNYAGTNTNHLIDLYAGVGLFGALIPARSRLLIENNPFAVADARINLDGMERTSIQRKPVERWQPVRADLVIADPSRSGLGPHAAERIAATMANRVILVSCDVGPMGRDLRLLHDHGYRLESVTLVDLFPNTSRIEAVSFLTRA